MLALARQISAGECGNVRSIRAATVMLSRKLLMLGLLQHRNAGEITVCGYRMKSPKKGIHPGLMKFSYVRRSESGTGPMMRKVVLSSLTSRAPAGTVRTSGVPKSGSSMATTSVSIPGSIVAARRGGRKSRKQSTVQMPISLYPARGSNVSRLSAVVFSQRSNSLSHSREAGHRCMRGPQPLNPGQLSRHVPSAHSVTPGGQFTITSQSSPAATHVPLSQRSGRESGHAGTISHSNFSVASGTHNPFGHMYWPLGQLSLGSTPVTSISSDIDNTSSTCACFRRRGTCCFFLLLLVPSRCWKKARRPLPPPTLCGVTSAARMACHVAMERDTHSPKLAAKLPSQH
mmetsp:Transcript_1700/g.2449  ORF Transcript_1700/g.2449 Transcript_1700/m.2449 type:complete len:344 (-) Transcript_1700:881-1912(-)